MHKIILTKEQTKILPLIELFSKNFGLVGGTAIALHLGHRQSIDFDLFTNKKLDSAKIRRKILDNHKKIERIFVDERDEYTILVNGVKLTFLYYPFPIKFTKKLDKIIKLPDLLTLAAMKAYTLGRRAMWKDYVDLYFIMEHHHSIQEIIKKTKAIFKTEFNEKIFRAQLAYFKDINRTEKIIFTKEFKISDNIIQKKLKEFSLN